MNNLFNYILLLHLKKYILRSELYTIPRVGDKRMVVEIPII